MVDVLRLTDGGEHVRTPLDQPLPGPAAVGLACTTRATPLRALVEVTTPVRGDTAHPARRVVVASGHAPL